MITKRGPVLKVETVATYSRHRISQKKMIEYNSPFSNVFMLYIYRYRYRYAGLLKRVVTFTVQILSLIHIYVVGRELVMKWSLTCYHHFTQLLNLTQKLKEKYKW